MASFDPTNMKLNQMRKGYFVDYNLKTWQVDAWYEYDWGNDFFTDEYKLTAIGETEPIFLHVEEGDQGLECTITQPINIHQIDEDVISHIKREEVPPMRITFKGRTYARHGEGVGYFRNTDTDNWEELISWTYYDSSQKELISIEQWGPEDFEAHIGVVVSEHSFTNILPSGNEPTYKPTTNNGGGTTNWGRYIMYGVIALVGIVILVWLFSPRKSSQNYSPNSRSTPAYSSDRNNNASQRGSYSNSPIDKLIEQNRDAKTFSIILEDMQEASSGRYEHKYKVMRDLDDPAKKKEIVTAWTPVSPEFYQRNIDNQFMELASKTEDGKINKIPAPPGYTNYVGNEKYGQWRQDPATGNSFWEFYGKYAFMSSMFNMMTAPVYRNHYYDYRDNYYGRQPYYGTSTNGVYQYGTTGAVAQKTQPATVFEKRKAATESFKEKVRSSVQQSSPRTPTNPNTRPSGTSPTSSSERRSVDRTTSSPSSSYSTNPSSGRTSGSYSTSPSRSSRYSSGSSSSSSSRSRGGRSGK